MNMMAPSGLQNNIGHGVRMVTTAEYISVLESEIEILKRDYYKPNAAGGTGHFGTAIGVLEMRIREIEKEVQDASKFA